MPRKLLISLISLFICLLIIVYFSWPVITNDGMAKKTEPRAGDEAATTSATDASRPSFSFALASAGTPEEEKPLTQLQECLDDEGRQLEALRLARELAATGTVFQQQAAINALRWLGGPEAKATLVDLMRDGKAEVASEALQVLSHLLNHDLYAETPDPFEPDLWKRAIVNAGDEGEQESLLVLLSAYPPQKSIPILLDLQESGDKALSDLATEYLENNTGGEEITNREQGEQWLAEHLKEQAQLEKEEAQASNDGAVDLPRFQELKKILAEEENK